MEAYDQSRIVVNSDDDDDDDDEFPAPPPTVQVKKPPPLPPKRKRNKERSFVEASYVVNDADLTLILCGSSIGVRVTNAHLPNATHFDKSLPYIAFSARSGSSTNHTFFLSNFYGSVEERYQSAFFTKPGWKIIRHFQHLDPQQQSRAFDIMKKSNSAYRKRLPNLGDACPTSGLFSRLISAAKRDTPAGKLRMAHMKLIGQELFGMNAEQTKEINSLLIMTEDDRILLLFQCMLKKYIQSAFYRNLLLLTGDAELVERCGKPRGSVPPPLWASFISKDGSERIGHNVTGQLLMIIRTLLKNVEKGIYCLAGLRLGDGCVNVVSFRSIEDTRAMYAGLDEGTLVSVTSIDERDALRYLGNGYDVLSQLTR